MFREYFFSYSLSHNEPFMIVYTLNNFAIIPSEGLRLKQFAKLVGMWNGFSLA